MLRQPPAPAGTTRAPVPMSTLRPITVALAVLLSTAPALRAQSAAAASLRVEPSGRATTRVSFAPRAAAESPPPAPLTLSVDYGQPHARGRQVVGQLIPYDQVWRTGANQATSLQTSVDLELGGVRVPRGSYTLYSLLSRTGWKLIINRQTGQWGTQYDPAQDLTRVPLQVVEQEPTESFTMTLVPAAEAPAHGALVLSWGTLRGTVPWRTLQP